MVLDFSYDGILGRGVFGTVVYSGKYADKHVAVKVFPCGLDDVKNISAVLECSDYEKHENVVHILRVVVFENMKMHIIRDMYDMNLEMFLENGIDQSTAKIISQHIVDGIAYLHDSNIVHGNLCPSNVLIRNNEDGLVAVLSDCRLFELMPIRWKEIARSSSTSFITEWMAPEILLQLQKFERTWTKQNDNISVTTTFSSDVFSVGCLLFYVATNNRHLFGPRFFREANILRNNPVNELECPYQPLALLVRQMTTVQPSERLILANSKSLLHEKVPKHEVSIETKFVSKESIQFQETGLVSAIKPLTKPNDNFVKIEEWQRTFIRSNLQELVESTSCSTKLLTLLNAKGVLSDQELHEIDANQNPKRKAHKLYEIVGNRKHAYHLLLDACKETKQTGVVAILEDGERQHNLGGVSDTNDDKKPHQASRSNEVYKSHRQLESSVDVSDQHGGHVSKRNSKASKLNLNQTDTEGRTALHRALADGGSLNEIKNLIEQGANFLLKDNKKEGALHFAVGGGNKEVISFLLSLKLDVNEVDELGDTPLHKARFTKSRDFLGMTRFLVDKGADLGAKDKNGNSVAHLFALAENVSSEDFQIWVKGMIDDGHGNIFAIPGQHGRTPIQAAMQRLDLDLATVKLMLESSKLDIDHQDDNGNTPLNLALRFGRSLETLKNLVSLGAEIKMKDKYGSGVLHLAVEGGNKEVIQYLISKGLDVNQKNYYGKPPLHNVIWTKPKKYVVMTKLLMESGSDLYSKDKNGHTLAHEMAIGEDVSCDDFKLWVTAMIENGHANLFTIRGQIGRTPLHLAMQRHDLDLLTIKLIVESAKLDINQPDDNGDAILHSALYLGRSLNTIQNLLALGADWKKKGNENANVLSFAVLGSNKEAFLYFKSLGADVNAKDKYGRTPLHYVPWTGSKDYLGMTKFLLENGANLNAKDGDGETLAQLMPSRLHVSAEEYNEWKEGLIKLGHASLFHQKSSWERLLQGLFN